MPDQASLLPGTLDLPILKAVSPGRLHGYSLTAAGRTRLGAGTASWNRLARAIARSLAAPLQEG